MIYLDGRRRGGKIKELTGINYCCCLVSCAGKRFVPSDENWELQNRGSNSHNLCQVNFCQQQHNGVEWNIVNSERNTDGNLLI